MNLRPKLLCAAIAASTLVPLAAQAAGNVRLQFNNNPRTIALSRISGLANQVNYFPNSTERYLRLRLAEPLLCAEFPGSTNSNVRFRLLDANGDTVANNNGSGVANSFGGLTAVSGSTGGVRYETISGGDQKLVFHTTNELVCYTFDTFISPNSVSTEAAKRGTDAGPMRYSLEPVAGNVVAKGTVGDVVFADGFESPFVAPMDVVTTLNAPATVRADQAYVYNIVVSNTGGTAVNGVVVRDFFYKASSTSNPDAVVFNAGNWTCTAGAGANCGTTSGTGVIYASNVSLGAGAQVTFTATRTFNTSINTPDPGDQFSVAAAAMTNPTLGESVLSNNSAAATGTIVITQPPVITGLPTGTQTLLEDGSAGPFSFTISDPDTSVTAVTVTGSSNNTVLFPNANVVFGGSGANRTLSVTPAANANGSATITVTANDGTGNTDVETVNFSVTAVNDAPSFTFRGDCPVKNGSWNTAVVPPEFVFPAGTADTEICPNFTVPTWGPPDEAGQNFISPASAAVEIVSNSNPAVFAQQPRFSTATNQLDFRPNGSSGSADVTIRIRDNGGTANGGVDLSDTRTFRVRVQGAAPTMSTVATQTIFEDGTTGALALTVADADTPVTALTLSASSSDPSVIPAGNVVFGGSGANRTVSFTPLPDQFGFADITLTVSDGAQQTQQVVRINVTSVNDAPTFSNLGDVSYNSGEPSGLKTITGWANTISMGPPNESGQNIDSFFVEILSQSPSNFFSGGTTQVTNSGNLRFSLTSNGGPAFDGFACLRVTLFDDGPDSPPNQNASTPVVVKVQVGPGSFSCASVQAPEAARSDR